MDKIARYERMLFDYQTTNRTDIRDGEIKDIVKTEYKEKPGCLYKRPPPLGYTQTLTEWKDGVPPRFDLLIKPTDIVHTDPRICQEPFEEPADLLRAEVQRTRPRLVMTPAVSLDDVTDESARDLLCRFTYTSTVMQAGADAQRPYFSVRAPFGKHPAPSNVIKWYSTEIPYVHPAWRHEMLAWDNEQLRTHADVDKHFWLRQKRTCAECVRTAERKRK